MIWERFVVYGSISKSGLSVMNMGGVVWWLIVMVYLVTSCDVGKLFHTLVAEEDSVRIL